MTNGPVFLDERTIRQALEVAQLGFWDHEIDTGVTRRSPQWAEMLGFTPEDIENHVTNWLDLVHPEDLPRVEREIEAHEKLGKPAFRIEHRMRTREGQWKWILNWGRIVTWTEDGTARRALGFHLDITDRKESDEVLRRADKLATLGTLAGGIAHDFNNLLTVIQGNLEMAREVEDPAGRERYLDRASRAVHRSRELTQRLLTFARGGKPNLEAVNLEQVFLEARDLALSGSCVRVQLDTLPDLPPVAGDHGQLVQVLQNLLLNGRQAMPEGGTITLQSRRIPPTQALPDILEPGSYVELLVRDQGPGIPDDMAQQVFDPFFTTKPEGNGLGLATSHSIIREHKGLLELLPPDPALPGAAFRILLPVAGTELQASGDESAVPASLPSGRIIVMDDDEMVREIMADVVLREGFIPVTAQDGRQAVTLYREALESAEPVAAVIMDLTIPGGMGGKEAVREILACDPAARVIVSSGYSDNPVMSSHTDYGFKAALKKPFELSEMRRVLKEVLEP